MHVRRGARLRAAVVGIVSASLFSSAPLFATAITWDNSDNNNSWFDANDWNPNVLPSLSDSVTLPTPTVGSGTIALTSAAVTGSLIVNDNYTFTGGSASLQVGTGSGFINVATNKNFMLSVPLHADANALTFGGSGVSTLNNASSRTGTTNVQGLVRVANAAALGSGTIHIFNNGLLDTYGGLNVVAPITLEGEMRAIGGLAVIGGVTTVATGTEVLLYGGVLATDTLRFGNATPNAYTGGASTTTVINGPGTVLLQTSNDYAGTWEVDTGTLRFFNAGALGSNAFPVEVQQTGTLYLDDVTFNHNVTWRNNATIATNNGGQSFGTITVGTNSQVTWAMHGTGTETVGLGANALTGGDASSSISVTSDNAAAILQLNQSSNFVGSWSIGSNATVQLGLDVGLGATGNSVAIAGGTLQTTNTFATARPFNITGASTLDVASGTTFTMSAGIGTGSDTTTKTSAGTLVLAAASTRGGTIAIAGGEVHVQNATGLGTTSSVTIAGGTALEIDGVNVANSITMAHASTLRGSTGGYAGSVTVNNNSAVNFATVAAADTFTVGTLSGGGGTSVLNFNGPGAIALMGGSGNTATGLYQINGGTLTLFKFQLNAGVPSGANVSIGGTGSGILSLGNSEQIWDSANVNVFSGQFQLNGFTETIGTVTMSPGGSIVGGGGTLILNGGASSGITTFGGPESIACNINLGSQARVFNIADAISNIDTTIDGIISGTVGLTKNNAGTLELTGASANTYTGATSLPSGRLLLGKNASGVVAVPGDLSIGDGSGSDIVQLLQAEQIADTSNVTIASSGQLDLQTFKETINTLTMTAGQVIGSGTLHLSGNVTTNASATSATIATIVQLGGGGGGGGNTFTIADGAAASDLTISGPVVSGTLNKSGAGKLTLSGATTSPQNLTINLNAGSLDVTATQHLTALNVAVSTTAALTASGTTVLNTNNLSITGNGKLDISNNKAIVNTTPTGSFNGTAYTGVTGLVASGRNGNTLPLWDGGGIVTSQSSATGGNFTSIGVARASDVRPATATTTATWAGQTITGTDTLVMYTYGGDATLDGKINVDDYIRIDSGIAAHLTGWSNGDFNYDGVVNIDDYTQFIDANIGTQGPPFSTADSAAGGAGVTGVTSVPEPVAGAVGMTIQVLVLGRRRRRR